MNEHVQKRWRTVQLAPVDAKRHGIESNRHACEEAVEHLGVRVVPGPQVSQLMSQKQSGMRCFP